MVGERVFQSASFASELEDAWRHRAAPICMEMGVWSWDIPLVVLSWEPWLVLVLAGGGCRVSWSDSPAGALCGQPRVAVAVGVWGHLP